MDEQGVSRLTHGAAAHLVVGADGRNSTVARLTGARRYNVVPNKRALFWGFFENARMGEPTFVFHRWADRMVQACPTDRGLYQVGVFVELEGNPVWIDSMARRLGFSERDYITDTYARLYLDWCKRRRVKPRDMVFKG